MTKILITAGALLLLTAVSLADILPSQCRYREICEEIVNGVSNDQIEFKQRDPPCPLLNCPLAEPPLSRLDLCYRLTSKHNAHAASFIGGTVIYAWNCLAALTSPQPYGPADWSKWAGKHCGTWRSVDGSGTVTQTFTDNALWQAPTTYSTPWDTFHLQRAVFERPGTCCDDGWNESGGGLSVAWGWDPKDSADHGGYQGSCVAYSFTKGSASCLIWITGQEAFLECVATGSWGRRRTSVGFWGFGLWTIYPLSPLSFCPIEEEQVLSTPARLGGK